LIVTLDARCVCILSHHYICFYRVRFFAFTDHTSRPGQGVPNSWSRPRSRPRRTTIKIHRPRGHSLNDNDCSASRYSSSRTSTTASDRQNCGDLAKVKRASRTVQPQKSTTWLVETSHGRNMCNQSRVFTALLMLVDQPRERRCVVVLWVIRAEFATWHFNKNKNTNSTP
jgi:hypothetical protein